MARPPRKLTVRPGYSIHKVWRGHNREWNLGTGAQKSMYLQFMNEDIESDRFQNAADIHAIVVMSSHDHNAATPYDQVLYSNHMRRHHGRYGMYFNRSQDRCGKVAQDRPHTTALESEQQEMETIFYIHANPIRAGIVRDAKDYFWSTHKLYAFGKREPWMRNIKFPNWYLNLGKTPEQRQKAYRKLFDQYLREKGRFKQQFLKKLFFGSFLWCNQMEAMLSAWRNSRPPPQLRAS